MTTYRYTHEIPVNRDETSLTDLDDMLEKLRETGEASIIETPGSPGRIEAIRFTVEADDLWDLHEIASETVEAINAWPSLSRIVVDRVHVTAEDDSP